MTPREAAAIIGCSVRHVRTLVIRNKLRATKVPLTCGYEYHLNPRDVRRYAMLAQPSGWPRGQSRKGA